MPSASNLPPGFEDDLAPFVAEWGDLATQDQRYRQRQILPMARLEAYYAAVCPRLQVIFDHLDRFPYGQPLPPPEALLFRLVMAMTEVAQAIEIFGQPTVPGAPENHSVKTEVLNRA